MAPVPDRQTLESLKRAELQRICKEHGVKANQKSEDLINQLLDIRPGNSSKADSIAKGRIKHKRSESKLRRVEIRGEQLEEPGEVAEVDVHQDSDYIDMTAAGTSQTQPAGIKPRALTKSLISPRGRRRIRAGQESNGIQTVIPQSTESHGEANDRSRSRSAHTSSQIIGSPISLDILSEVDKRVADAIRPMHEQAEMFKLELEKLQTLRAESDLARAQATEISMLKNRVESLQTEVEELRAENASVPALQLQIDQLKEILEPRATVTPPNPRTPPSPGNALPRYLNHSKQFHPKYSGKSSRAFQEYQDHPHLQSPKASPMASHPGVTRILLGKRHRDSVVSDMFGADGTSSTPKPERKRPKLSSDQPDQQSDLIDPPDETSSFDMDESGPSTLPIRRPAAFTVFNDAEGPPEVDMDAPPTNRLPEFFARSSPLQPAPDLPATNTTHITENQQPFRFSFLPPTATPAAGLFQNTFPYLDPSTSPTPAGVHSTPAANQTQGRRTDVFQTFGLPAPGRPARFAGRSLGAGSDEHSTLGRGGRATSRELASDNSPMKRTMYGTELEGDTRFGDFGVEGVGGSSNFWSGK